MHPVLKPFGLRKIRYNAELSKESTAFTAVLTYKGKSYAKVENDGTGHCPISERHPKFPAEKFREVEADLSRYSRCMPCEGLDLSVPLDAGEVAEILLAWHLVARDMRQGTQGAQSKTLRFVSKGNGDKLCLFYVKLNEPIQEKHFAQLKEKAPDAVLINGINDDELMQQAERLGVYTEPKIIGPR